MKLPAVACVLLAYAQRTYAATYSVSTCDELVEGAAATRTEDTTIELISETFNCDANYVTLTVEENILSVVWGSNFTTSSRFTFNQVRIEVVSSGQLVWEPRSDFIGNWYRSGDSLELNGGWLYVEEGSKARFQGMVEARYYRVSSTTDEGSDFSSDKWYGGCIYNQGYTVFEEEARFFRCHVHGGGESSPGDGGAIYNGDAGSMLFEEGVRIEDSTLIDNEGGAGAGIYNLGKVNIKADSYFTDLWADTDEENGGAIYNGQDAKFTFRQKSRAFFINCRASSGGAVYNTGEFRFTGAAFFTDSTGTAVVNRSPGTMKLSDDSLFWNNGAYTKSGAVINYLDATMDVGDDIIFEGNYVEWPDDEPYCDDIYFELGTDDDAYYCYSDTV